MFQKFIDKWNRQDADNFHFRVSIVKSSLRIVAGMALTGSMFLTAGTLFIAAEVLGIIEEV